MKKREYQANLGVMLGILFVVVILMVVVVLSAVFQKQPINSNRYCTAVDYKIKLSDDTMREHSEKNNKQWLYLNWYEKADNVSNFAYLLKETDEEICYREEIVNGETDDFVKVYVTDNRTEMDTLNIIKEACSNNNIIINQVNVNWAYSRLNSYAIFEYQEYRYYLTLEMPMTETAILDIVEEMLPE